MGLYVGDKPVDMFSMLHKRAYLHVVTRLPDAAALAQADVGIAYCLTESYDAYLAGHIYKVAKIGNAFVYEDLNADGAAISAFVNADGSMRV